MSNSSGSHAPGRAPLVILGTSGHAREILMLIQQINAAKPSHNVLGFLTADSAQIGSTIRGFKILGLDDWLRTAPHGTLAAIGLGTSRARSRISDFLNTLNFGTPHLIHPNASVGHGVQIGIGTQITAGCTVTTDVTLGQHVLLNVNSSVSHDSIVEDYVSLGPGARLAGNVHVGAGSEIGMNASILPGVKIGPDSVIGAGAVVIADVPAGAVMVGVPAKPLYHS